jgi:hypothetical protein
VERPAMPSGLSGACSTAEMKPLSGLARTKSHHKLYPFFVRQRAETVLDYTPGFIPALIKLPTWYFLLGCLKLDCFTHGLHLLWFHLHSSQVALPATGRQSPQNRS